MKQGEKTTNSGLVGLKEIAAFYGCSQKRILELIRSESFPAVKICGTWESDKALIEKWRRKKIRRCLEE